MSNIFLKASKDKTYSVTALQKEVSEKIQIESASSIDYIHLGKTLADAFQDEISFQLYYIAYLKDRKIINTNSELQFE